MQSLKNILKYKVGKVGIVLFSIGLALVFFTAYPLANGGLVLLLLGAALVLFTYLDYKRITGQQFTEIDTFVPTAIFFCLGMILVVIIATIERMVTG